MANKIPQNILITGGAGFVGRNLVKHLLLKPEKLKIWVIDDLSTGLHPLSWPEVVLKLHSESKFYSRFLSSVGDSEIIFINKDITSILLGELGKLPIVLSSPLPSFTEIYHLASIVGGRAKIEGEPLTIGLDLAIDSIFFLWAVTVNNPDRVLYASSSAAYPVSLQENDKDIALSESMIDFNQGFFSPDFTYGWSKLTGEYLSKIAVEKYGMSVAVIRPFSGYGEYQEPVYPVPAIAMRAASKFDPLFVWGTGEQARDFIHIEDCVIAMQKAIMIIKDGSAINIGSGVPTTFLELATLMADLVGYKPLVKGQAGKPVGVSRRFCDPQEMHAKLEFIPSISIQEGIKRVLAVAESRLNSGVVVPI